MGDDQEEQIKKKKRLILLMLLALLAVTAGAAALVEPTPATTVAALVTSPSPPTTNTFTATPQVQGDEWLQPTPSSDALQKATVVAAENDNEASSPDSTPTIESQQQSEVDLTATEPGSTPSSASAETREASYEPEINPVTPLISNEAISTPTEISRRINESWDVLDGSYSSTAEAENAALTLAATATLTEPATLSETMAVMPPDGLPVTGTIAQRGVNWGAVAVVLLLVGAGVAALLYPRPGHR